MAENQNTIELENKIKIKVEQYNLYEKELTQLELKNESLKKEIQKRIGDITNYQKQFGSKAQTSKDNYKNVTKATAMITLEEQILKEFSSIQHRCNLNLQEKYKLANIERLVVQQKELNISYIIIKKLDIKEEFYINNKIIEVPNLFENLKSISKIGKLNYDSLKNCGPYLVFRLTSDSKFVDVKQKACSMWGVPDSSYSLYDDMFISMECVNEANIQAYFSFYQPTDSTLPPGHACFYLMEKLKNQKSLLETQNRTLDKVDSGSDSNNNKGQNMGTDLENCINKIEEEKILKGINSYKRIPINSANEYKKKVFLIDNNIVFIILAIGIFVLSIYGTQQKKSDIVHWSNNNQINFYLIKEEKYLTLKDSIVSMGNIITKANDQNETGLKIYNYVKLRFFITKEDTTCLKDNYTIDQVYDKIFNISCYYSDYVGDYIDKVKKFMNVIYSDNINIKHIFDTGFGKIGKDGHKFMINTNNTQEFLAKLENINQSGGNEVQGFEFQMVVYDINLDIFTSICILIQRDLSNSFQVSELHVLPFKTNVYENHIALYAIDLTRLILLIILLFCIVLSIIQKCWKDKKKTAIKRSIIIITSLFKIKYLLIIFAFSFNAAAFAYFNIFKFDSIKYATDPVDIDFYAYSQSQKDARNYDLISLYLIFIFLLKYLQFVPYIDDFYKSFKKAAFELFFLFFIMLIMLLSLSYLTFYVYGPYLKEYSTFYYSLINNIKILFFIENSTLRNLTIGYYQDYAIVVYFIYIFIMRFFLFLLIYPIIIEYLRIHLDNKQSLQIATTQTQDLSAKESMHMLFNVF